MKYLLLICHPESVQPTQEKIAADPVHQEWLEDVTGRGLFVGGSRLRPAKEARSVRVRKGKSHVIDGPFAETKEVVGGYVVVECDSIDEAIDVAAGHPFARTARSRSAPSGSPSTESLRLGARSVDRLRPVRRCHTTTFKERHMTTPTAAVFDARFRSPNATEVAWDQAEQVLNEAEV